MTQNGICEWIPGTDLLANTPASGLLRRIRSQFNNLQFFHFIFGQTTTAADVELENITDESAKFEYLTSAGGNLNIYGEADQEGDHSAAFHVEYCVKDGDPVTPVTGTLNASNSSTAVSLSKTNFYRLRDLRFTGVDATDDIFLGLADKSKYWGIIPAAAHTCLHSRYYTPLSRNAWLLALRPAFPTTDLCTVTVQYTPYGKVLAEQLVYPDVGGSNYQWQYPCARLATNTDCITYVKRNADSAHDILTLEAYIAEAW